MARPRGPHVRGPLRRREPPGTVSHVDKDLEARTLTITAEFDAPLERVWELWAEPRKLERRWGPLMAPSSFERHELEPGGTVTYFMTSPEGERFYGVWHAEQRSGPRPGLRPA